LIALIFSVHDFVVIAGQKREARLRAR
jgi:hypothetical protein